MNKIIMTLGIASSLLTSPAEKDGTEVYCSSQLVYAMNNIEDMQEWIERDKLDGKIDSDYAEFYWEVLNETHGFILDYYNHECK